MKLHFAYAPLLLAWAASGGMTQAQAQNLETVSARDPEAMVKLLDITGHKPKLGADKGGDPKIDLTINGYQAVLWFYDCDSKTHKECESVQAQVSFNRKDPWPAADAITFAKKWRFGGVYLDDEGDPTITYDIVLGDGIPSKVFLVALDDFGDAVQNMADMVFPKDKSQDT